MLQSHLKLFFESNKQVKKFDMNARQLCGDYAGIKLTKILL